MKGRSSVFQFFLVVLSVAMIVCFSFWCAFFLANPYDDAKFNQQVWLSGAEDYGAKNPRGPMATDLITHHLRVGMLRADVRKLLGKPNNSQMDEKQGIDRYFLGHWGRMSIDGDYLIIRYDQSGRIRSRELYQH